MALVAIRSMSPNVLAVAMLLLEAWATLLPGSSVDGRKTYCHHEIGTPFLVHGPILISSAMRRLNIISA
jgi:hypothetical protein